LSESYFLQIEGHFASRRGTPFVVSAKDWALMKAWLGDGIPLAVVIEAIDSVFEKNGTSGRRKTISSLSYCRHAVKELWQERQNLYVGGSEAVPEAGVGEMLDALAVQIREPFATRVRDLASLKSVPKIEEALIALEGEMLDSIIAGETETVAEIRAEVARAVGDGARLDEKTKGRTIEANLRRLIREKFALPRLTLFA
jgi:hypothetical protein